MKNEYEKEKIRKFMIERGWTQNEITYENMDSNSRTLMYARWNIGFECNKFFKPIKKHFEWLFDFLFVDKETTSSKKPYVFKPDEISHYTYHDFKDMKRNAVKFEETLTKLKQKLDETKRN